MMIVTLTAQRASLFHGGPTETVKSSSPATHKRYRAPRRLPRWPAVPREKISCLLLAINSDILIRGNYDEPSN